MAYRSGKIFPSFFSIRELHHRRNRAADLGYASGYRKTVQKRLYGSEREPPEGESDGTNFGAERNLMEACGLGIDASGTKTADKGSY